MLSSHRPPYSQRHIFPGFTCVSTIIRVELTCVSRFGRYDAVFQSTCSVTINKNVYRAPNSSQLSDPALITAASPPQQPRASEPRRRKIRICSNSGEVGHNVRTCPESYCSFCVEDGHKLRDCTLAQEEAEAIKQQEDEEAAVRVP